MELPPSFEARETAGTGPLILGIGGPTRSGKTTLALNLARMFTGSRYGGPEADFDAEHGTSTVSFRKCLHCDFCVTGGVQFCCSECMEERGAHGRRCECLPWEGQRCIVLHQDSFIKPIVEVNEVCGGNFDCIDAIDHRALREKCEHILQGRWGAFDLLVLEGFRIFYEAELVQKMHHTVWLHLSEEDVHHRRMATHPCTSEAYFQGVLWPEEIKYQNYVRSQFALFGGRWSVRWPLMLDALRSKHSLAIRVNARLQFHV